MERGWCLRVNANGVSSCSPRVACVSELPWVAINKRPRNPEGVHRPSLGDRRFNPVRVEESCWPLTQGSLENVRDNLGLEAETPLAFSSSAHGWWRRKNWAGPVSGSCTLRFVAVTVGVFVTVDHETAGSEMVASSM